MNLSESIYLGTFPTLEQCRGAALAKLRELEAEQSGDYECGKNCRPMFPDLKDSVEVCEETLR